MGWMRGTGNGAADLERHETVRNDIKSKLFTCCLVVQILVILRSFFYVPSTEKHSQYSRGFSTLFI